MQIGKIMFRSILNNLIGRLSNDKSPPINSAGAVNKERLINQTHIYLQTNLLAVLPGRMADIYILPHWRLLADVITKKFSQNGDSLIELIDRKADQYFRQKRKDVLATMDYNGMCYGLEMTWYAYAILNREVDFFADIQEISRLNQSGSSNIKLTPRQKRLLKTIAYAQKNQGISLVLDIPTEDGLGLTEFYLQKNSDNDVYLLDGQNRDDNLLYVIRNAFSRAHANQGSLIQLSFSDGEHAISHTIGVIKFSDTRLGYFDSNFRRIYFENTHNAIHGLHCLFKFNYGKCFSGKKSRIKISSFEGYSDFMNTHNEFINNIVERINNHRYPLFGDMKISMDKLLSAYFRPESKRLKNHPLLLKNQNKHSKKEEFVASRSRLSR